MPESLSITAIRDAQSLSQREIDKIGIKSHPEHLQSERYRHWLTLCKQKEYVSLYSEMESFLTGNEAITTYEQVPKEFQAVIRFSEYHGYKSFDLKEFAQQVELSEPEIKPDKKIEEKDRYNHESEFFNLITNLNDQLLAKTQSTTVVKHDFNLQGAIRSLKLAETIYRNGTRNTQLSVRKHFARPLILNSCILEIDPCSLLPGNHRIVDMDSRKSQSLITRPEDSSGEKPKDKDCKCKEEDKNCRCNKEKKDCTCQDQEEHCECKCNDKCVEQNPCCARIKPYVAELFVVRDEICKYDPGEISYIENIMESEIRVRKHRHLQREETFAEQEEEVNTYEEKDLQVDEQFSLHKEIDKVVEQSLSVNAGATYNSNSSLGLDVGGITIGASKDFSASLDTSYNFSKQEARKLVLDESKNVISQAISRVEKKVRTRSTKTLLNEIEEKNKHVFGGTTGAATDISRQFYYVNQIRKAQLFSYGKRAMLDFYLPEPAELLKRLVEKQFDLKKPVKPCVNIDEIGTSEADWLEYVQCYGFQDLEKPPQTPAPFYELFKMDKKSKPRSYTIPAGYQATRVEYYSGHANRAFIPPFNARITINVAGIPISRYWRNSDTDAPKTLDNLTGNLSIEVDEWNASTNADLTVKVTFSAIPVDMLPWQLEVHKLLMQKYEDDLAAYNEALAEFEKSKENHFNKNPFILSQMMKEQLKHAAISYITCQFFDENDAMKNKVEPCGFPQMDIPESKKEGELVRFIEQAFEWKFMNYMLYPYFWARKCSWEDKFQEESENYLFTKFLQSGYARVSISVRPGFEGMMDYYLRTRKIWDGNEPPIIGDAFVPIHQEIKESQDNFNADREGYLKWDASLNKDEIQLFDNLDYYTEDTDSGGNGLGTYSFDKDKTEVDLNREITINCVTYRIVDIEETDPTNHTVKLTLDRELEVDCCCSGNGSEFDDVYLNRELPWSTGAEFIGAPWKFKVPTSLTWLREEGGCLPCYPIKCND